MNLKKRLYYPYIGAWYTFTSRFPIGTNIYEREWDVAIILDTCRVDAINQVKRDYDFITDIERVWSVGSSTPEWLINTFIKRWRGIINKTTRISANGFDDYILRQGSLPPELDKAPFALTDFSTVDSTEFNHLEVMYHSDFHDARLGTVPPQHVTNRSIAVGRELDWDRLIIHYIQPHAPYISEKIDTDSELTEIESRPMWALRNGLIDRDTGWDMYIDNLRLVLDNVAQLLTNLDADKVVLTADHGESFGEYRGKFGHIDGYLMPQVRSVPWIETKGTDEETVAPGQKYYTIDGHYDSELDENRLKDHLKDLGYF